MKILLDTHVFVWWITDQPTLSSKARKILEKGSNRLYLSIASAWEMAIKISLEKLVISEPLDSFLTDQLNQNAIEVLPIQLSHALRVSSLPFYHRDPFDRLLVAQSQMEGIPLLSNDRSLKKYGASVIW